MGNTTDETSKQAIHYLQGYYVDRPNIARIMAMTVIALVGLAVAAYRSFYRVALFITIAYIL